MNTCERQRKHTQPAPAPEYALQFWSEVFLVVPLVMVMRGRELERRAGKAEGLARRSDVSTEGSRLPDRLPQHKVRLAAWKRGDFSFAVPARTSCVVFWWFDQWATAKIFA